MRMQFHVAYSPGGTHGKHTIQTLTPGSAELSKLLKRCRNIYTQVHVDAKTWDVEMEALPGERPWWWPSINPSLPDRKASGDADETHSGRAPSIHILHPEQQSKLWWTGGRSRQVNYASTTVNSVLFWFLLHFLTKALPLLVFHVCRSSPLFNRFGPDI